MLRQVRHLVTVAPLRPQRSIEERSA
jgi:hypothetical protein